METPFFNINEKLSALSDEALARVKPQFAHIDEVAEYNVHKVLAAFAHNRVSESHFVPTTGYGYGDRGRDTLDAVFAEVMGAEDALVRHSIVSGTHAITIALFGVLRPGDTLLAATGAPYDTLETTIGHKREAAGSLKEFGVHYKEVPLNDEKAPDLAGIASALADKSIKMVHIQRSRGYDTRPSLKIADIKAIIDTVKAVRDDVCVFVDNCYGEFAETVEPTQVGADLMAGSLIKNAGGGIAQNGGYLCGKASFVELCAARMTTPGLGREVGASLGHNRELFMGLFHAPQVVGEAMKTAVYAASLFDLLGYEVSPKPFDERGDIIEVLFCKSPKALCSFCRGMQRGAPVDAFVVPEPSDMPGYDSQVIMAAGAFTMGSSIELSADAPLREPFAAFMQGGLNFHAGKLGVILAAQTMLEDGIVQL